VDYGYLDTWLNPRAGRRRRVWAFIRPVVAMDQRAWTESQPGFSRAICPVSAASLTPVGLPILCG
jgi:hypothetical protein